MSPPRGCAAPPGFPVLHRSCVAAWAALALAILVVAGCSPGGSPPATLGRVAPSAIPFASATPVPTGTHTPTFTPAPTATPDPYAGLTIDDLAARSYGGGAIQVLDRWNTATFERVLFRYPSDGLEIHGFANVPFGEGPFPVVLVLHGYVDPQGYETLAYTQRYADDLASAGFLVLHPNYRNYPPSALGPNAFRVGFAIDVLNLVALVREGAGQAGLLEKARSGFLGLFGHSMGGGIALRVTTVDPMVDAAVLYGSMSGDEAKNFERILEWSGGRSGWEEFNTLPEDLERISPIHHLERIQAAVSIHHGELDNVVPPTWSDELCEHLQHLRKAVECFRYPGQAHSFYGEGHSLFLARVRAFYEGQLEGAGG